MNIFVFISVITLMINSLSAYANNAPEARFFAGNWGVVAYNNENDLMKMANIARSYCDLPYKITYKGGDVLRMYVEKKLTDVKIISKQDKFYIVPAEENNGIYEGARELIVINNRTFTLEYLQDDLNAVYGKNVFVRCGR